MCESCYVSHGETFAYVPKHNVEQSTDKERKLRILRSLGLRQEDDTSLIKEGDLYTAVDHVAQRLLAFTCGAKITKDIIGHILGFLPPGYIYLLASDLLSELSAAKKENIIPSHPTPTHQ